MQDVRCMLDAACIPHAALTLTPPYTAIEGIFCSLLSAPMIATAASGCALSLPCSCNVAATERTASAPEIPPALVNPNFAVFAATRLAGAADPGLPCLSSVQCFVLPALLLSDNHCRRSLLCDAAE